MADGTYERRGPREAELKRLQRLIEERRAAARDAESPPAATRRPQTPRDRF